MILAANSFRRLRRMALVVLAAAALGGTSFPSAAVATEDPAQCLRRLDRALERRGFALALHEIGPEHGPSVVDALDALLREDEPAATVTVVIRGATAHVRAPFLGYREARALIGRARRSGRPLSCALMTELLIAEREEDRLRGPLFAIFLAASAAAGLALRRGGAQKAK